jgi:hypothetical protein
MAMTMHEWITIAEYAKRIKKTKRTVRRSIEQGKLHSRMEEGRRLVMVPQLEGTKPKLGRRGTANYPVHVLSLYEHIRELKGRCEDHLGAVKIYDTFERHKETIRFSDWRDLYALIMTSYTMAKHLTADMQVNWLRVHSLYEQIWDIRERWVALCSLLMPSYALDDHEAEKAKPQQLSDRQLFEKMLNDLRTLLIALTNERTSL